MRSTRHIAELGRSIPIQRQRRCSRRAQPSVISLGFPSNLKITRRKADIVSNRPTQLTATFEGKLTNTTDVKIAIVVSKFNSLVTKSLLEGARSALSDFEVPPASIDVYWVPGSFELPLVAKTIAQKVKPNAVICIGTVIRGSTSHYDAVVNAATSGVLHASLDTGVPVIFGVLTCENLDQALARAGGHLGNKGYEAAVTALEMSNLISKI